MISQNFGANLLNNFFAFLDTSEKTISTYRRALKQFFKFLADNGIKFPSYDSIINFKKSLQAAGRKATTISLYLASIRRFFSWTEQRGIYPNISNGVKSPRLDKGFKKDFLGATQLKNIIADMPHNSLEEKRNFAIFSLISACGLRTIEIVRANIEDLRNVGDVSCLFIQGKGKQSKSDFVKIESPILKAIKDYLSARGQVRESDPLFTSTSNRNNGSRLTTRSVSGICKRAMRAAGFDSPRLSAHSLRHSAVTLSLLNGARLDDTQSFARHESLSTTQIYSHAINRLNSPCEHLICKAIFGDYKTDTPN